MLHTIQVKTSTSNELIDITREVKKVVKDSNVKNGICYIYTPHTTAAITINENADPDVQRDLVKGLYHFKLEEVHFQHMEGNSPSHVKSSLFGCSETVFIEQGDLYLGTWQGIYFCEFDGPRSRKVVVKIISE